MRKEHRVGQRRRLIDPATCERDYSDEEKAFMLAIDVYKRHYQRPFPTCSEALQIAYSLGYRLVAKPIPMKEIIANKGKFPTKL